MGQALIIDNSVPMCQDFDGRLVSPCFDWVDFSLSEQQILIAADLRGPDVRVVGDADHDSSPIRPERRAQLNGPFSLEAIVISLGRAHRGELFPDEH